MSPVWEVSWPYFFQNTKHVLRDVNLIISKAEKVKRNLTSKIIREYLTDPFGHRYPSSKIYRTTSSSLKYVSQYFYMTLFLSPDFAIMQFR